MADPKPIRADDWIKKVHDNAPEGATAIVAFVSEPITRGEKHYRQLYSRLDADEYLEVLEDDIAHHEPLPPERSPLGGSIIWLKPNAHLKHVQTSSHTIQKEMLRGTEFRRRAVVLEAPDQFSASPTPYWPGGPFTSHIPGICEMVQRPIWTVEARIYAADPGNSGQ